MTIRTIATSCFAVILLIGLFVRGWQFGRIPVSLYWDEAAILVDAKVVSQTGKDMHGRPWWQVIYPSYGDYKLAPYIWLASASVKMLGVSEQAVRLPSLVAGIWTIVIAGLITKRLFPGWSKKKRLMAQLTTMLVVAVSPWSVMFSRTAFEGHLAQAFFATAVYFALDSKWWSLLTAQAFAIAATYTYFSVRFVWPEVFVLTQFFSWPVWKSSFVDMAKAAGKWGSLRVLVPLILFGLLCLPMMWAPFYQEMNRFRLGTDSVLDQTQQVLTSNQYREITGNNLISRVLYHRWWLTGRELLFNYADHIDLSYLFLSGDPNLRHGTGRFGLFVLAFFPSFVIGWYVAFRRTPRVGTLLLGWWFVALLPAAVPQNTPHALRSQNALVPLAIVIGLGLAEIIEWAMTKKADVIHPPPAWVRKIITTVYVLWLFLSTTTFFIHYFQFYPTESASDWQSGYKELVQVAVTQRAPEQFILIQNADPRLYLWFLAYGPYKGSVIQTFPTKAFQFEEFDGIVFNDHTNPTVAVENGALLITQHPSEEQCTVGTCIKNAAGENEFSLTKKQ